MFTKKMIYGVLAAVILFTFLLATGHPRAQSGPTEDRAGGDRQHLRVALSTDGAPQPGGSARLVFTTTPLVNTPNLQIEWFIPEGVELQGQTVETLGAQTANQAVQSERTLTFPSKGTYKIAVSATFQPFASASFSAAGVLFFVVDDFGSYVTDKDPNAHPPVRSGLPEQATVNANQPAAIQSTNGDPCFTVLGHIERVDRPVSNTGYGANVIVPVVNAPVEVRESDTLFDDSYGTVLTDANGNWSKSFCDDDGWFDDTLEIYYRLVSERRDGGGVVYTEDSSWIDEKYEYDSSTVSSDGGTINFNNLRLDMTWSGLFNIIDAASLAKALWINSGDSYGEDVEIHWEANYGDSGSYFDPFWNEITVADDPSDPDQWDDSVIMHEWGHSADDYYSCDDNPGGTHFINQLVSDDELSWGEGYPDYYQSAVRAANGYSQASWYFDINGTGTNGIKIDFEPYDTSVAANLISTYNELAVAAALWDLNDNANDGQDTISYGHATVQDVYTSSAFKDQAYGFWDDTCNFDTYIRGWIDAGKPKDAATAAVILQNTNYTLPATTMLAREPQGPQTIQAANAFTPAEVYRWWNQLTYVADNSASMNGPKFDAVKTLFGEAVNDLGSNPLGTEFSLELFNNTSSANSVAFAGQFFPANLIGPINALTTNPTADPDCNVYALRALAQAVDNKEKGDAWLFTDGDTYQAPSVEAVRQLLNNKQIRASVALMGICPALSASASSNDSVTQDALKTMSPDEQQAAMSTQLLNGQARAALGPMAADVPGGLVPYLLTALNSGGQFLYVDSSRVNDAADILRAQITNSAGAGRWSDYVSDQATYRFDKLANFEYGWVDATTDGTILGNPDYNSYFNVALPSAFPFYDIPYSSVQIFQDGYLSFGAHYTPDPNNTTLPNGAEPNNSLYPLWDDLYPTYIITQQQPNQPSGYIGWVYTKQQGDWFVIEYINYLSTVGLSTYNNTFEVLLNTATGEIRYQYLDVSTNGAGGATIGLENGNGSQGIQVSYNDAAGAAANMGYKFTAAPPQPAKTYTVAVDSSMQSVGFLLTGYSGTFEPLVVNTPDGTPINCSDSGVLCLNLDLVQYVQVNTNNRTGNWQAVVDAGPSGEGTFSFTSFAASPLSVQSRFDHTLSTSAHQLLLSLTQPVDGNLLTGFFLRNNGTPFGASFQLYDDGTHGDGRAADGVFGSDSFTPPGAGSGFLRLGGTMNGEAFERIDPRPYTFTPLEVKSLGDVDNDGGPSFVPFQLTNYDTADHCYWVSYDAPDGWYISFPILPLVCVNAGLTDTFYLTTYMSPGTSNDLPSGTTGLVTVSFTEYEKGEISDSDSARVTRRRLPASVTVFSPTFYLRPNGDTANLEIRVLDDQNVIVADGTYVALLASSGTVSPTEGTTLGGMLYASFISGPEVGTTVITATTFNGIIGTTEIDVGNPKPNQVTLQVSDSALEPGVENQATLTATVTDRWGDPVAGQEVHIGVEGDGQYGLVEGLESVTGTTDANGQFVVVFTRGDLLGKVGVRADLYYDKGSGLEIVQTDRKVIGLGNYYLYLPLVSR